ncbi:MAG: GWxTD domain-containing protein, partial [bacterium]
MRRMLMIIGCIPGLILASGIETAAAQGLDPKYIDWRLKQLPEEIRHEAEALRCVLSPYRFGELLSIEHEGARRRWIEEYWRDRDPVYTTEENEERFEHNRRVAFAESHFYIPRRPMWDQRGEVYIRYGPPAFRHLIPRETTPIGVSPAGELWFYPQHDMYVLFEDAFGNGEYSYYLERVQGPPRARMDRIHPIDKLMGAVPPMLSAESIKLYEDYHKGLNRFYEVLEKIPASYPYDFEYGQLPFVFSVDEFRGGDWTDRVDVNIEFSVDAGQGTGDGQAKDYVATAVFWDTRGKEAARREQHLGLSVPEPDAGLSAPTVTADAGRLMPMQLVFTLDPGFYHMAVTLEEPETRKISSYRCDVTCLDFESKLEVSDVLFASRIAPSEKTSPFVRGPLEVVPHPSRSYRRPGSIPVYVEVYNLSSEGPGGASYTVEYEIRPSDERGGRSTVVVSSSFNAACDGPHDVVHLAIDTENLWEGEF